MSVLINYLQGSVFDIPLQDRLGLDSLIIFRKQGFHPMDILTLDYLNNPNPRICSEKTLIFNYNKAPRKGMVYKIIAEKLDGIAALGARRVGISQLEYSDHFGKTLEDSSADDLLKQCVGRWVEEKGDSCSLESINILIDSKCKSVLASRLIDCEGNVFDEDFLSLRQIGGIFAPIQRGFSASQGTWMGYERNQKEGVLLETYFYDKGEEKELTVEEYRNLGYRVLDGFAAQGVKNIATFGMYLKDDDGHELTKGDDDTQIKGILADWVKKNSDKGITVYYVNFYHPQN